MKSDRQCSVILPERRNMHDLACVVEREASATYSDKLA